VGVGTGIGGPKSSKTVHQLSSTLSNMLKNRVLFSVR
jgi:hypothetical protein